MGDQAGQLAYGIQISFQRFKELHHYYNKEAPKLYPEFDNIQKNVLENSKVEYGSLEYKLSPIELDTPYEIDDCYIFIKESNRSSYNGGRALGKQIEVKPEWDQILKDAIVKYGLEDQEPQWYLIGHYN